MKNAFFVGGSNSIRAWKLRELGPGTYRDTTSLSFDRTGDLKLEMNGELRFPIYGVIKGALFTDAGNVWTYKEDPSRKGAKFEPDSFYRQLAIASGIGLRLDFGFFVFRTDFAIPLRDPSYPEESRWVINNISKRGWLKNELNLSIGVGYPF